MAKENPSFSQRHGFKSNPPITIWEDVPEDLRYGILQIAKDDCGIEPEVFREIVCRILRKQPDSNNWSYSNVWGEVVRRVQKCEWFKVYDIVEALYNQVEKRRYDRILGGNPEKFTASVNELLTEFGIGWQLRNGQVQPRGEESYESVLHAAEDSLQKAGKSTALKEVSEAIKDISKRPTSDCSGAIQHSMAALECVARDVTGDPKPTLGQLMKLHRDLFPKPVDTAVEKLWGYASENARHGREGNDPSREEAMLVVGLSATLANYLIHKTQTNLSEIGEE